MSLKNIHPMKWLIWVLGVSFYFYEFFIRVFPTVMVPQLMKTFSLSASTFGIMVAFYFYIYAPMQLPIGGLMDRYGARKLLTFAALCVSLGTLLFYFASGLFFLSTGRFLMGFGSAFAFVGMIYICSHWFPPKKLAFLIGLGNSIGMLGAVFGEGPLSVLVDHIGWQSTILILAIAGFVLTAIIFIVIRNEPKEITEHPKELKKENVKIWALYKMVLSNRNTWLNAIGGFFLYATIVSFAGLWADIFLQRSHGLSKEEAAFAASMVYLGMVGGGPIFGHFSDRLKKRKPFLIGGSLISAIILFVVILVPQLPAVSIFVMLAIVGIILGCQILNYPYAMDINPDVAKGTATSFTNFFVILSGVVFQPLVGILLDFGKSSGHSLSHMYSQSDYRMAMMTFPISLVIAAIFFMIMKEEAKAATK